MYSLFQSFQNELVEMVDHGIQLATDDPMFKEVNGAWNCILVLQ
jgi:hypothetical protein